MGLRVLRAVLTGGVWGETWAVLLLHVEEVPPHLGRVPTRSKVECAVAHVGEVGESLVHGLRQGGHVVGAHRGASNLVARVTLQQ